MYKAQQAEQAQGGAEGEPEAATEDAEVTDVDFEDVSEDGDASEDKDASKEKKEEEKEVAEEEKK